MAVGRAIWSIGEAINFEGRHCHGYLMCLIAGNFGNPVWHHQSKMTGIFVNNVRAGRMNHLIQGGPDDGV